MVLSIFHLIILLEKVWCQVRLSAWGKPGFHILSRASSITAPGVSSAFLGHHLQGFLVCVNQPSTAVPSFCPCSVPNITASPHELSPAVSFQQHPLPLPSEEGNSASCGFSLIFFFNFT